MLCVLFISPSLAKDKKSDVAKDKREAPIVYPGSNAHHQISVSPSIEVASGTYHQSSAPQISYAPSRNYGAPSGHQDIYSGELDSSVSIGHSGAGGGGHGIALSNSYTSAIEGSHGSLQGFEDSYSHSDSSSHGNHELSAIVVDGSAAQAGRIQTVSYKQSHPSIGHGYSANNFGGSSHGGGSSATIQITPIPSHSAAPSLSYGVPQSSGHGSGGFGSSHGNSFSFGSGSGAHLSPSISYGVPSSGGFGGSSSGHGFGGSSGGHGFGGSSSTHAGFSLGGSGHGSFGGSSRGHSGGHSMGSFSSSKVQRPISVTYGVPSSHSTPSGSYGVPNPIGSHMSFGSNSKGLFSGSFGGSSAGFGSHGSIGSHSGFGFGGGSNFGGSTKFSSGPSFSGSFSHGGPSSLGGFSGNAQSFGHGGSFGVPSGSYGPPMSFGSPFMSYGHPMSFGPPSMSYGAPSMAYGPPAMHYGAPAMQYGPPSGSYGPPSFSHGSPISSNIGSFGGHGFSSSGSHSGGDVTPSYAVGIKGLRHYSSGSSGQHSQSISVPHISKPIAVSTQPTYHSSVSSPSKAPFRPSTFLGAHIESNDQYSSSQQYSAPSHEYGAPIQGGYAGKSFDDHSSYQQPSESYGTPSYNTIQYSSPSGH